MSCEEWKVYHWGDLLTLEYGKGLKNYKDNIAGVPVYGTNGLIGYTSKALCKHNGIIIGRKGVYRGVQYSSIPFYVIDTAFYVEIKKSTLVDYKWAYYQISTYNINSMDSGSAIPSTSREDFYNLSVKLPPLSEQKTIAATLSCFDEKIELNNRMNKTLEEIAQAIFKSWFVDFEPFQNGEFVDSELGPIPMGWKVVKLGDVTMQIHDRVRGNNLKVLSAIKTGHLTLSEEYFTKQVFSKNIKNYIIVEPHVFAYNPARINIGSIGINDFVFKGCVSPVYVVFKTEPKYYRFFNMYIRTPNFKQEVITRASGSVRQTLNYSGFSLITIVYPPVEIVEKFNTIYDTLVNTIKKITIENNELTQIRNSLLPKLMSGEIEVPVEE